MIVLVMSLSFANLILIPSLLSGVTAAINGQQVETVYSNIVISPNPDKTYLDHVSQIEQELSQQSGVIGVAAHLNSGAFFEYNWAAKTSLQDLSQTGNWHVIGIDPEQEINVTSIHTSLIAGSYLEPGDRDKIVLGVEIAGGEEASTLSSLTLGGAKVGDKVRLTFPNHVQREYTLKGIFKARSLSANSLAFISRNEMASVMNTVMDVSVFAERASQLLVRTEKGVDENQLISDIKNQGIDGQVKSWRDYGETMGGLVSSFDIMGSLIGSIGLLVAAIVMFIVIYINVVHKKRQIGILRAIGITRSVVYGSYLIQSFLFAILGIVIGGLLFGYGVMPYFKNYPIDLSIGLVSLVIDPVNVRNSVIGILLAAVLAGIIPVVNIVRQSIIKAIWGS